MIPDDKPELTRIELRVPEQEHGFVMNDFKKGLGASRQEWAGR